MKWFKTEGSRINEAHTLSLSAGEHLIRAIRDLESANTILEALDPHDLDVQRAYWRNTTTLRRIEEVLD